MMHEAPAMEGDVPTRSAAALLAGIVSTVPPGEDHARDPREVRRLLEMFAALHEECGAPLPEWLGLGLDQYRQDA